MANRGHIVRVNSCLTALRAVLSRTADILQTAGGRRFAQTVLVGRDETRVMGKSPLTPPQQRPNTANASTYRLFSGPVRIGRHEKGTANNGTFTQAPPNCPLTGEDIVGLVGGVRGRLH